MKKFNIILLVALLLPVALSAKKVYEAEKVVNHNFPASSNHTLVVDNKYGDVNIQVWDKNEISATITITGMSSRSQEIADGLVNRVKINANASGNTVTFRTEIASSVNITNSSGTQSNEINYQIKVPRNIAFNLTNKYGNIVVDECGNTAKIDVKYGNFRCPKMKGDANLTLGYGNATVQEAINFVSVIKYSDLTIGTAQSLSLDSKYSKIKINKVHQMGIIASGYDDFKVDEVDIMDIDTKYTPVKIGKVNQSLNVTNKYGSVKIDNIDKKVNKLDFSLGYTDLKINIPVEVAYEFDITSKYGSVKLPQNTTIKNREKSGSTTTSKGTAGSGTPTLKLKANNSYSDISITTK